MGKCHTGGKRRIAPQCRFRNPRSTLERERVYVCIYDMQAECSGAGGGDERADL